MALFYSSVPVSHYGVTVKQREQCRDPATKAAVIQPSLIVLFTPALFSLWHVKMSSVLHKQCQIKVFTTVVKRAQRVAKSETQANGEQVQEFDGTSERITAEKKHCQFFNLAVAFGNTSTRKLMAVSASPWEKQ